LAIGIADLPLLVDGFGSERKKVTFKKKKLKKRTKQSVRNKRNSLTLNEINEML
jgi:hypothetical protein